MNKKNTRTKYIRFLTIQLKIFSFFFYVQIIDNEEEFQKHISKDTLSFGSFFFSESEEFYRVYNGMEIIKNLNSQVRYSSVRKKKEAKHFRWMSFGPGNNA